MYSATYSNVSLFRLPCIRRSCGDCRFQSMSSKLALSMSCDAVRTTGSTLHTSSSSPDSTSLRAQGSSNGRCKRVSMRRSRAATANTRVRRQRIYKSSKVAKVIQGRGFHWRTGVNSQSAIIALIGFRRSLILSLVTEALLLLRSIPQPHRTSPSLPKRWHSLANYNNSNKVRASIPFLLDHCSNII